MFIQLYLEISTYNVKDFTGPKIENYAFCITAKSAGRLFGNFKKFEEMEMPFPEKAARIVIII